jgi:hypothetical protein
MIPCAHPAHLPIHKGLELLHPVQDSLQLHPALLCSLT